MPCEIGQSSGFTGAREARPLRRHPERYSGLVTPSDQPQPEYSEDGVDLTLIRWMLTLTPAERLEFLEDQINSILEIRELNGGA
jgi:hypothetical protein